MAPSIELNIDNPTGPCAHFIQNLKQCFKDNASLEKDAQTRTCMIHTQHFYDCQTDPKNLKLLRAKKIPLKNVST